MVTFFIQNIQKYLWRSRVKFKYHQTCKHLGITVQPEPIGVARGAVGADAPQRGEK